MFKNIDDLFKTLIVRIKILKIYIEYWRTYKNTDDLFKTLTECIKILTIYLKHWLNV